MYKSGTITWEEFVKYSEELVNLSDQMKDYWQFIGDKKLAGHAYLMRREKLFVPVNNAHNEVDFVCKSKNNNTRVDEKLGKRRNIKSDPFEEFYKSDRPLIVEHHVLYSTSYRVPVIYFNGWQSDFPGINPLSVEAVQQLSRNGQLSYIELSQTIHPLLDQPYLYLHPCGTRSLLSIIKSANPLVSWLSVIAPIALNLCLRTEYFDLTLSN